MVGLVLAGIAALIIGFGLKKVKPAAGGLICGAIYFAVSLCTISGLASSLSRTAGDATVGLVTALFTEGIAAGVVAGVCAVGIFMVRKLR